MEDVPNPGSDAALAAGCTCAVMDNNHGKWKPWTGSWWITGGCPVHDPDLGAAYGERVTQDRELTPEDEATIRDLLP